MQQQFNGGTVKEQRIKALIIQYDDSIRYQKKLLDCYLAEELHSAIPMCMNDDEELEKRLKKKTTECERLKLSLELAEERVPKFHLKYLQNTAMKEFLDFAIYLSTFRDSDEDIGFTSKTEKEKLFQYFGISSDIYHDKELNKDTQGAGSRSGEFSDRGTCSTLPANVINEDLLTLNSKLESAQESLDAEKEHSSQLQSERDNLDHLSEKLCRLLFEYQKRIGIHAEKMKTRDEPSNDKDRPNIKAVCDSSLITRRPSLQSDIECSIDKLKPSPSQNVKGNRSPGKDIDSVSMVSKKIDRKQVCNFSDKLKPSPSQNAKRNLSYRKDIGSVSMVSKSSDQKQDKHIQKPILATTLTNNENIEKNNKSTNVGVISHETPENEVLLDERDARLQCAHCDERCSQKAEHTSHIHSRHFSLVAKQFLAHGSERPFKCSVCSKTFKDKYTKVRHERVFHGDAPYQCFHCNKGLDSKRSLTQHIYGNHFLGVPKQFKCAVCDKSYITESHLKQHELNHQPPQFKCTVCAKEFFLEKNLKKHTLIHVSERRFECSVCHKKFKDSYAERQHRRILHEREARFQCAHCDKRCRQKSELISHINFRHFSIVVEEQFKCTICDKSFRWKNSFQRHQKLVHGTQRLFKCSACDLSFKHHVSKTCHEWKSHKIGKSFRCTHCDRSYRCEKYLIRHMQVGHDKRIRKTNRETKLVRCDICNLSYSDRSALNRHIRVVHNKEKRYACPVCAKQFFGKGNLKAHTLIHGSERPFECSVCHKKFKIIHDMKKHQRIVHEGEARYQCAHCDKRCGHKSDLISHIHWRHFSLLQKQFKCTLCDKSFYWKHSLKTHQYVHDTRKLFKCSACDLSFKDRGGKLRHEWKSHKIGKSFDLRCMHCDRPYRSKEGLNRHMQESHVE